MPDFAIVSEKEAQLRTMPGRQGKFINEYADFIQQLPQGQAGKLHVLEHENPWSAGGSQTSRGEWVWSDRRVP
jgi:hypothetical protein